MSSLHFALTPSSLKKKVSIAQEISQYTISTPHVNELFTTLYHTHLVQLFRTIRILLEEKPRTSILCIESDELRQRLLSISVQEIMNFSQFFHYPIRSSLKSPTLQKLIEESKETTSKSKTIEYNSEVELSFLYWHFVRDTLNHCPNRATVFFGLSQRTATEVVRMCPNQFLQFVLHPKHAYKPFFGQDTLIHLFEAKSKRDITLWGVKAAYERLVGA